MFIDSVFLLTINRLSAKIADTILGIVLKVAVQTI